LIKSSTFFTIILAIGSFFYFDFIGRITISELVSFGIVLFINVKEVFKKFSSLAFMFKCLFFYLLVQIFSDIYNEVLFKDFSRGWSVIIFCLISTVILVKLFATSRSNIIFFLCTVIVLNIFNSSTSFVFDGNPNLFKTKIIGFLNPTILLFSIYFTKNNLKFVTIVLFLFYAIFSFYFDGRSNGIIFLVATLILLMTYFKLRGFKLLFFTLCSFIFSYFTFTIYIKSIESGIIIGSNSVQQFNKLNNSFSPYELLKLGRGEVFIAFDAALEKPLLGYGSWAKDKGGFFNLALAELNGHESTEEYDFIPSHSLLFGGFLYSGIFGFFSLLFLLIHFFKIYFSRMNYFSQNDFLFPLYTYLISDMIWSMLFSPFGLLRTTFPFFAAVIIVCLSRTNKTSKI